MLWSTLPEDIMINHIMPFLYRPQPKNLMKDVQNYVVTYENIREYTKRVVNDRFFLEEYVLEEYGMPLDVLLLEQSEPEIFEQHLSDMSIRWFYFKLIHNNVYNFVEIWNSRLLCQDRKTRGLLHSNFHRKPVSKQFRVLWALLKPKERANLFETVIQNG
jgi:hypothetical protein